MWPGNVPASATATTPSATPDKFDWEEQFELSLDPETARSMHDEILPDEQYKEAAGSCAVRSFCS